MRSKRILDERHQQKTGPLQLLSATDNCSGPAVQSVSPSFGGQQSAAGPNWPHQLQQAIQGWLAKTPSQATRVNYARDLRQFLDFHWIGQGDRNADHADHADHADCADCGALTTVLPSHISAWRDQLQARGAANSTIRRKLTALRSLYSYLQIYGYTGANPAHGKFVKAPAVSRDGKTVGLASHDCRRLLEAPDRSTPAGLRDRALLAVLAYSACRVGELVRLHVGDFKTSGEHRVLNIYGKGGKERTVPLHVEAIERLTEWLAVDELFNDRPGPLFRSTRTPRGQGRDGFHRAALSTRAVERLVRKYVSQLRLDPAVTVHSLRVTALTTARERGADIIDLQDFAGHADPRTTLTYIRARDRLSKSPTYVLNY